MSSATSSRGAGGWGDPLERDPQAVLRDLRNEMIGDTTARNDYGVIVDRTAWRVDHAATEARRAELRAARAWTEPPAVSRGEMPETGSGAPESEA